MKKSLRERIRTEMTIDTKQEIRNELLAEIGHHYPTISAFDKAFETAWKKVEGKQLKVH